MLLLLFAEQFCLLKFQLTLCSIHALQNYIVGIKKNSSLCPLINETMTVASLLCHSESQVQSVFPHCLWDQSQVIHLICLALICLALPVGSEEKKKRPSLSERKVQRQLWTDVSSLLLLRGPGKLEQKPQKEILPQELKQRGRRQKHSVCGCVHAHTVGVCKRQRSTSGVIPREQST